MDQNGERKASQLAFAYGLSITCIVPLTRHVYIVLRMWHWFRDYIGTIQFDPTKELAEIPGHSAFFILSPDNRYICIEFCPPIYTLAIAHTQVESNILSFFPSSLTVVQFSCVLLQAGALQGIQRGHLCHHLPRQCAADSGDPSDHLSQRGLSLLPHSGLYCLLAFIFSTHSSSTVA